MTRITITKLISDFTSHYFELLTVSQSPISQNNYQPAVIERRWQRNWHEKNFYRTSNSSHGESFYALSMFPYPSGKLHMGHVRNYVITDVIARVQRMRGKRVLHPMGWDAFGLPAENAAIERGIDPAEWTKTNISQMRSQLDQLGLSIDWERELSTCDESYYQWTQWLFLQFYEAGLAYQKEATVNWDPIDQTVLANEQVNTDGRSWRSGAQVEKRKLRQWFLKITNYAERLLNDLDHLSHWPERVRTMQANWIGRSKGAEFKFYILDKKDRLTDQSITVFTTRPDTIYGVTYLTLSVDHELVKQLIHNDHKNVIASFCQYLNSQNKKNYDSVNQPKQGIFLGKYVIHPLTGKKLPIWTANYVISDHGTGAVMGVPAHDQRDFVFARCYGLPIKPVIYNFDDQNPKECTDEPQNFSGNCGNLINSGPFDGLTIKDASDCIMNCSKNYGWGYPQTTYKLHDWLISRQRYWGCPIPIIHCEKCGTVPIPISDLPVTLPKVSISGKGGSPLSSIPEWTEINCPQCGQKAQRETDTMDTFICSSWYFLRYSDPLNTEEVFDKEKVSNWLPVNHYVGGIEHAILHLLYSRFFTKVLYDRGLLNFQEPFIRLLPQGMVQGATYRVPSTGAYIPSEQIPDLSNPIDPVSNEPLEIIFEKMSKSKGNGVDPNGVIETFGADTARMFILFKAPPGKDLEWNESDVEGQFRFLQRVWKLVDTGLRRGIKVHEFSSDQQTPNQELSTVEREVRRSVHATIAAVTEDLDGEVQFNTAIAELMKLCNALSSVIDSVSELVASEGLKTLITLLAPFSPHLAEELWFQLSSEKGMSIHAQPWPILDPSALVQEEINIVIQINGKVRGSLKAPISADNKMLEELALTSDAAQKWLKDKSPKRIIVIPRKLINIVA
uniref:leucine--tRNA ligase n=1 Tax=Paulinella micropora TaxID=1928728 RepID=A0A1L5YB65_9EUKA|nr:t-RNA synthetase, class Ia [Paulinella micropora]AQX44716.1 t-RNA synthetase, class Ia:Leucyl-tRNA synthetase [Paulinella micropora]